MRQDAKNLFHDNGYVESNSDHQVEACNTNTHDEEDGTVLTTEELVELLLTRLMPANKGLTELAPSKGEHVRYEAPCPAENELMNLLRLDISKETTLKEEPSEDTTDNPLEDNLLATTYPPSAVVATATGWSLAETTDDSFCTGSDLHSTENSNNGSDKHLQEATDITYALESFCHASSGKDLEVKKCLVVGYSVQSRLKEVLQKRKRDEGVEDVKTIVVPPKRKRAQVDECPPVTDKKLRRQTQNRNAARRFRDKQRTTIETLSEKSKLLKEVNTQLRTEHSILLRKRDEMKKYLDRHLELCSSAKSNAKVNDTGIGNLPINLLKSGITPFLTETGTHCLQVDLDALPHDLWSPLELYTEGEILVEDVHQGQTVLEGKPRAEMTELLATSSPQLGSENSVNPAESPGIYMHRELNPGLVSDNNPNYTSGLTTVMLTPENSPECEQVFNYTVQESGDSSADRLASALPYTPEPSPYHNQTKPVTSNENNSEPCSKPNSPSVPQTASPNPSTVSVPGNGDVNDEQAGEVEPDLFTLLQDVDAEESANFEGSMSELSTPVISPMPATIRPQLDPVLEPEKVTPDVKVEVDLKVWNSNTRVTSDWSGIVLADFCLNSDQLADYSFSPNDNFASLAGFR